MFCPKCATNNLDGASFCRGCGANISLVPQALTGQIVQAPAEEVEEGGGRGRRRRRDRGEVNLDQAFKNIFMGIAFLIIAVVLSRTIGYAWWFWMLLPSFSHTGTQTRVFVVSATSLLALVRLEMASWGFNAEVSRGPLCDTRNRSSEFFRCS